MILKVKNPDKDILSRYSFYTLNIIGEVRLTLGIKVEFIIAAKSNQVLIENLKPTKKSWGIL